MAKFKIGDLVTCNTKFTQLSGYRAEVDGSITDPIIILEKSHPDSSFYRGYNFITSKDMLFLENEIDFYE